jgi:hypothetical protein
MNDSPRPTARSVRCLRAAPLLLLGGCALLHPRLTPCTAAGAEPFIPGTISTEEKEAFGAFSPDGQEFYFTRFSIGRDRSSLLVSRRVGEAWGAPEVLPFSGRHGDREPFITPDGQRLFFVSDRPHPEKHDPSYDLWMVERLGPNAWGTPRRLPEPINSVTSEASPVVTRKGTLYFASGRPGGYGGMDLYRARPARHGFAAPENLGPPVSTDAREWGLYVSPDERVMVITRTPLHHASRPNLHLSVWRRGRWSETRPVGPSVNSEAHEFGPMLSPDGQRLYFTRDATQVMSRDLDARMDIHYVDACQLGADAVIRSALARMSRTRTAKP